MRKLLVFLVLSLVPLGLVAPAFVLGVRDSGDLTRHFTWLEQFYSQLRLGIFYPRWLEACADGFGEPVFMYYAPGAYYLGSLLMYLGLTPIEAILAVVLMAYVLVGWITYLFLTPIAGMPASLLGAVLTQLAPTTYVLFFGRSAPAWTLAVPLALFTIFEASRARDEDAIVNHRLALGIALTTVVHTLTGFMILIALLALFVPLEKIFLKSWSIYRRRVVTLLLSLSLGLGLASFYLLPALLAKRLLADNAWLSSYLDYRIHFAFAVPVEYSSRYFAENVHAIICLAMLITSAVGLALIFRRNRNALFGLLLIRLWSVGLIALVLATSASWYAWERLPPLHILQFPTRFLSIAVPLSVVIVFALIAHMSNRHLTKLVTIGLVLSLAPIPYISARHYVYNIHRIEASKFDEQRVDRGITSSEYAPKSARRSRVYANRAAFESACEAAGFICQERRQTASPFPSWSITIPNKQQNNHTVILPHFYYPAWQAFLNGEPIDADQDPDSGLIRVFLPSGINIVHLVFRKTTEVKVGIAMTIFSSLLFLESVRRKLRSR